MGRNLDPEAKMIDELGGPGSMIGWGVTTDTAVKIAIATQLKRIADALDASLSTPTDGEKR